MKKRLYALAASLALAAGCSAPAPPADSQTAAPATDMAMSLHHMHGLMAHGFEMALEGATLKMLGQMNMAGQVDTTAVSHGDAMLGEGKDLIDKAIAGPAMAAMHAANANDPAMTYTHDLAKAMTAVVDQLQLMPAPTAKDMGMHHMHIALVHAALMASQGATLKMTAEMKMADTLDQQATDHAATMLAHARALYEETMNGEAMKSAHAGGGTSDDMSATHDLGTAIKSAIDSLASMP